MKVPIICATCGIAIEMAAIVGGVLTPNTLNKISPHIHPPRYEVVMVSTGTVATATSGFIYAFQDASKVGSKANAIGLSMILTIG